MGVGIAVTLKPKTGITGSTRQETICTPALSLGMWSLPVYLERDTAFEMSCQLNLSDRIELVSMWSMASTENLRIAEEHWEMTVNHLGIRRCMITFTFMLTVPAEMPAQGFPARDMHLPRGW